MEIEFENIGFIRSGKIKTNNITIIFGPNNVGKTYLSYSTYAAISKYNEKIKGKIKIPKDVSRDLSSSGVASLDINSVFTESLIKSVNNELSASLPSFFKDGTGLFDNSKINVIDLSMSDKITSEEVTVNLVISDDTVLSIKKKKNNSIINFSLTYTSEDQGDKKHPTIKERDANNFLSVAFGYFFINKALDLAANNAFIITSERTGISLFQKEIDGNRSNLFDSIMADSINRNNTVFSFSDFNKKVAKFSEPINHNINIVRDFESKSKVKSTLVDKVRTAKDTNKVKKIIETLESLTCGHYASKGNETFYVVKNRNGNNISIPISLSSASNKSLFLFDLYVRYYMNENSYLIIDEPELNLHPSNQIKMAELLVRLSNFGVKIIITTHSDYILKEINNRIMAFNIDNDKCASEFGYGEIDLIKESQVNCFTISDEGDIKEVEGNKYGINGFIFDNVISDIECKAEKLFNYLDGGC